MSISSLLKSIAYNKNKHIARKGGAIHYFGSRTTPLSHYKSQSGCGTVARKKTFGGSLTSDMHQLSLSQPPPKHFTRTKKSHSKPINFSF